MTLCDYCRTRPAEFAVRLPAVRTLSLYRSRTASRKLPHGGKVTASVCGHCAADGIDDGRFIRSSPFAVTMLRSDAGKER